MGVCTSTKNKKVESNEKDKEAKDGKEKNIDKKNSKKDKEGEKAEGKGIIEEPPSILDIKVKFIKKGEEILEQVFTTTHEIKTLFEFISQHIDKYAEYELLTSDNESLLSHIHEKIYTKFPDKHEIELTMFYLGLEISQDIKKEYKSSTTIIATPLLNLGDDIAIVTFNKFTNSVSHSMIKGSFLNKFNYLSGFCNGKNHLFICGGESQVTANEYIADFCSVNLSENNAVEQLAPLNEARAWHSMIFIPPNFIFIVSGSTKTVEIYDMEKKTMSLDSELNEMRGESTLCCFNNAVLYAFCGFVVNDSFLATIEQCNLKRGKRVWNYVNYTTSDNVMFEQCYYIVSFFSENSIILFGTCENSKSTTQNILFDCYDEDNPVIRKYDSDMVISDICPEKFFHPFVDNSFAMFPLTTNVVKMYTLDGVMRLNVKEYRGTLAEILE